MCIKVIIQIAIDKVLSLVHAVPDFSPGVATVWTPGPTGTTPYSGAGKHRFKSGYTVLNQCSPGSGPGGFNFLINRDLPGCVTTPAYSGASP